MESSDFDAFPFSLLPNNLQVKVIEFMHLEDFAMFNLCSKLAINVCEQVTSINQRFSSIYIHSKTRIDICKGYWSPLPFEVISHLPLKMEVTHVRLFVKSLNELVDIGRLLKGKVQTFWVDIPDESPTNFEDEYDPVVFEEFLKTVKATRFEINHFVPRSIIQLPYFQKMDYLHFGRTGCTDEELLKLTAPMLTLTSSIITDDGLNKFLKQWKNKERGIEIFSFNFDTAKENRKPERILEGLEANLIWSKESHHLSVVSKVPTDKFWPYGHSGILFYSVIRPDDLDSLCIVKISEDGMGIMGSYFVSSEADHILDHLEEKEFFKITGRCKYCQVNECGHVECFKEEDKEVEETEEAEE